MSLFYSLIIVNVVGLSDEIETDGGSWQLLCGAGALVMAVAVTNAAVAKI